MASRAARASAAVFLLVGVFVGLLASAAGAEAPSDIADEVADDGVYVSRARSDVDENELVRAVQDVRFDGLRLVAVAPIDPQPDPKAYARRIREVVDADAALIFVDDGTVQADVIDDLSDGRIRAIEAARAAADPARAVSVYANELTNEPQRERPPLVSRLILAVILLAVVVAVINGAEQAIRAARSRRRGQQPDPGPGLRFTPGSSSRS